MKRSAKLYRKEKEKYLINGFETLYNGLNKNIGGWFGPVLLTLLAPIYLAGGDGKPFGLK